MNIFSLFAVLILFVLSMPLVIAQELEPGVAIMLERTACHGRCPIYTVTIYEDGRVTYEGERFVAVTGQQSSEIDAESVAMIIDEFENAGYFGWNDAYDAQTVSDLSTVITSVRRNGETKRIVRYAGDTAPIALPFLELWIDEMTNSRIWTGVEPDISAIVNGTVSPLLTIQRSACVGFCPVYNAALFEDGSIVFMGIANVSEIGVRVFETEPSTITDLAGFAHMLNYFNWQDRYDHHILADQPTVITSIQWEDQFKRIVRNSGDPSAPVGLVQIEDRMSSLLQMYVREVS
jgi:hypothetical protein